MHHQEEHQLSHGRLIPKITFDQQLFFQVLSLLEGPGALDPGVASDCLGWVASHLAEVRAVYQNDYLVEVVKKKSIFLRSGLDSTAVSIFADIVVELTNSVFVNRTNTSTNIETAVLSS